VIGFVLRRFAIAVVLLWILSAITFVIYLKVPQDPAGFLVDLQHSSPQQIAHAHHVLGTDRPAIVQYGKYMERLLHGDFGTSWATISFFGGSAVGSPVGPMIWRAALVTASLLVGLLLQLFVGNRWKLLPASGYCTISHPSKAEIQAVAQSAPTGTPLPCGGVGHWAWHLVLPWVTFALFFVALYMRIVRARMLEVLGEPWVRTARAKGASEFRVIRSHALRNAIAPVVTMVAMDAGTAIGIALYVETVFGLPGLGRTLIRALAGLQGYDLPVILAVTLVAAGAIIIFNLLADLLLLVIDPTVARRGGRGVLRLANRAA
jgi:peptide/nickel transport system permease protein